MTPASGDSLRQAFEGHGPLVAEMMAQRARDLARIPVADGPAVSEMQVLRLMGTGGAWALPVAAVARIEPLMPWLPLPGQPPAVLGLALLAGRRCLLLDADVVVAAAPPRPAGRHGHAVMLRGSAVALAVDHADTVVWLPAPATGGRLLADGSMLMDPARLIAAAREGGVP